MFEAPPCSYISVYTINSRDLWCGESHFSSLVACDLDLSLLDWEILKQSAPCQCLEMYGKALPTFPVSTPYRNIRLTTVSVNSSFYYQDGSVSKVLASNVVQHFISFKPTFPPAMKNLVTRPDCPLCVSK